MHGAKDLAQESEIPVWQDNQIANNVRTHFSVIQAQDCALSAIARTIRSFFDGADPSEILFQHDQLWSTLYSPIFNALIAMQEELPKLCTNDLPCLSTLMSQLSSLINFFASQDLEASNRQFQELLEWLVLDIEQNGGSIFGCTPEASKELLEYHLADHFAERRWPWARSSA
mmetsp:Transcript_21895/g.59965  ORF Transcript_21895/g.59965 Transcript_21895/m.59965 type:complete len:172 (+) Transcript_21895:67-582(+)